MANASGVYIWTEGDDVVVAQPILYSGKQPSLPLWHCCRFRAGHSQHAAGVWALVAHYTCTFLDPAWRTTYAWDDTVDWKEVGTWGTSSQGEMRYTIVTDSYRYLDFTVPPGHTGLLVLRAMSHKTYTEPDEVLLEVLDKSSSPDRSMKLNGRGGTEWLPEITVATFKITRMWDNDTQLIDQQGDATYRKYRTEVVRNIPPGDYRFRVTNIGPGETGHALYAGELQSYMVPDGAHARPGDVGAITHCAEFFECTGSHNPGPFMGGFGDAYMVEVVDHNGHWVGGTPHGHETQANQAWTADGNAVTPGATVQGPFGSVTWTADNVIKDQTDTHELIAFTQTRTFSGGKHSTVVDGTWRRSYTPARCLVGGWVPTGGASCRPVVFDRAMGDPKIGTLHDRTNDTSGKLKLEASHGITASDTIFIDWGTGSRQNVDVDSALGTDVDFSGGTGDNLPNQGWGITAAAYVGLYPYRATRARYGITFADDPDANMSLYDLINHEGGEFDLPDRRSGFLADRRMVFFDDIEGAGERNVGRVFVLDWNIAAATGTGNSDIDQAANTEKMRTGIAPGTDNSVLYTYYADGHLACAVDDPFHAEWDMYFVEEGYFGAEAGQQAGDANPIENIAVSVNQLTCGVVVD